MSDWHVLGRDGDKLRLVFHYSVPAQLVNSAGVSMRAILGLRGYESVLPGISQGEVDGLTNGSLYEVDTLMSLRGLDPPDVIPAIEDLWKLERARAVGEVFKYYEWWGGAGDVA